MDMATTETAAARRVLRKVRGQATSDGAGVRMTRVMGTQVLDHFDPFLLLDEFRSDDPSDYIAGFPDHPHRGFETVTYMLAGRMRHGDNQGNSGQLGPGAVQWMTAGRGIVHSEFPEQEEGLMWGFQLWVNLPATDKMTAPRYQDIQGEAIPEVDLGGGVRARVIAGRSRGDAGPGRWRRDGARLLRFRARGWGGAPVGGSGRPQCVRVCLRRRGARGTRGRGGARRARRARDAESWPRDPHRGSRAPEHAAHPRRRTPAQRADRALWAVRHEYGRRDLPGLRRLPRRAAVGRRPSGPPLLRRPARLRAC